MPEGPWHFPEDQLTDATDRMVAAELTREQLYLQLHAELPYASAVETEKWEDRKDGSTVIHQQILVERDSQKAIVRRQGRLAPEGDRPGRARGDRRASRPQGPPVPARQGQPASGTRTAGSIEDIGLDWAELRLTSISSPTLGTSTPAGP